MPIIMLYVKERDLSRVHNIIRLLQPLFNGEIVVDAEDRNIYQIIKTPKGGFFKVKQESKHFLRSKLKSKHPFNKKY